MKHQKPINSIQNSDEFSSGLMEAYGRWMGGDCFQNTDPVNLNLSEAPFDGMDPQSHGAEIEDTTKRKKTPKKGDIVVVRGKKKDGCVFADVIAVQTNKIYTKLSEIKKDE